jgi:hypothetical protein
MHFDRDGHIHERAQLPAGRKPGPGYDGQRQTLRAACRADDLHVCFHCSGGLVYPLSWAEEGRHTWRLLLRCPDCESRREGVFEQAVVERLDDELDRAASALVGDLRRLTHANMSEEIEFFIRALDADLIDPGDFERR